MTAADYEVVVGYDGSPAATEALGWAAREASVRRTPLTVFLASDLAPAGETVQDLAAIARKRGDTHSPAGSGMRNRPPTRAPSGLN